MAPAQAALNPPLEPCRGLRGPHALSTLASPILHMPVVPRHPFQTELRVTSSRRPLGPCLGQSLVSWHPVLSGPSTEHLLLGPPPPVGLGSLRADVPCFLYRFLAHR